MATAMIVLGFLAVLLPFAIAGIGIADLDGLDHRVRRFLHTWPMLSPRTAPEHFSGER